MEIEQFVYLNRLYSIYKQMLTEKQNEILALYLEEDFSLGEISEELNISRQAVHDAIKRSEQLLQDYEAKLGVLEKEQSIAQRMNKVIRLVDKATIDNRLKQEILDICKELV